MRNAKNKKNHFTKLICVDFGKSEFLKIHIFSWDKAFY